MCVYVCVYLLTNRFGESFENFQVDGQILEDLVTYNDFNQDDFPNARAFHWYVKCFRQIVLSMIDPFHP